MKIEPARLHLAWILIFGAADGINRRKIKTRCPPCPDLVVCEVPAEYRPRDPTQNPLCPAVAAPLETFLARQRSRERPVPRFVERELRSFLECGVLAHGFLRVHCDACGEDRVVAFSCYPEWQNIGSSSAASDGEPPGYRAFGG